MIETPLVAEYVVEAAFGEVLRKTAYFTIYNCAVTATAFVDIVRVNGEHWTTQLSDCTDSRFNTIVASSTSQT